MLQINLAKNPGDLISPFYWNQLYYPIISKNLLAHWILYGECPFVFKDTEGNVGAEWRG